MSLKNIEHVQSKPIIERQTTKPSC